LVVILINGATGNVGVELTRLLVGQNQRVRALVRDRRKSSLIPEVEIAVGDLNHPESLGDALAGVRRVFLLGGYPDMPGLMAQIRLAGAEHVVLLTSRSVVGGDPTNVLTAMWMGSEDAVRSSGVPWTILRPSGFMSNALRWLPQLRSGDVVKAPFANVPIAVIDPFDIAAVAAVALTADGHSGQSYALSGPEALLPAEQLRVLGRELGRNLRLEAQSDAEARDEISKSMGPATAEAFLRFFVKGEFDDSKVVPTVEAITGTKPRTLEQWVRTHADLFR
jgi:uncharacterized protein YbjT (DUF2867 family)